MDIFRQTSVQMLMMFCMILIGYIVRKKKILPEKADTVLARSNTFVFVPALVLQTQMNRCTVQTLTQNAGIILCGLTVVTLSILAAYPLAKLFAREKHPTAEQAYEANVYRYAMAFGNYGFMGNFIVMNVWGDEMLYKYLLFCFFFNVLCYAWGLSILIPKEQGITPWANLKKCILTPPMVATLTGMVLGMLGVTKHTPAFLMRTMEDLGKCQGPIAMVLAGYVIGGYDFKELLLNKKVYGACLLRLFLIPAVVMLVMHLLGAGKELMTLALIATATPLGLNTVVFPATYGGNTKPGASMAMISHALSVVTIPIMYLLFIVKL